MDETLLEYADCRGLALGVEREAGVIRGVKILGLTSRNGRVYPTGVLEQARALYEGAKVNVNHPKGNPLGPRDYQDRIGVIRNVRATADAGLFGDLHFNPRHGLAAQLEWDARNAPENVGLSHNVLARTARRDEQTIVEAITRVVSVDLVADPAATQGLYEAMQTPSGSPENPGNATPTLEHATAEDLRRLRPDLVAALATAKPRSRDQQLVEHEQEVRRAPALDTPSFVRAITR